MGRDIDSQEKAKPTATTLLIGANRLTYHGFPVKNDPDHDAINLRKVLDSIATTKFEHFYGYPYIGRDTQPKRDKIIGRVIKPLQEFTDCAANNAEGAISYIHAHVFPSPNSVIPEWAVEAMRRDLEGWVQHLLEEPIKSWKIEEYQRHYKRRDGRSNIWIDAMTIYTMIPVQDEDTLFLDFVGVGYSIP